MQSCLEKKENLEPERLKLGSLLRQYFEDLQSRNGREREQCLGTIDTLLQEKQEGLRKLEELRNAESELTEKAGTLQERIRMFDSVEERFN